MSSYITNPHIQFLDEDGKPLAYGTVETYIAGTSIEYATMKDFTGTMNPSKILLDDDGSCTIIVPEDQLIKIVIRTNEGRLFRTFDNVGSGGGSSSSGGDYVGSEYIAIDQIARQISVRNLKKISTDGTVLIEDTPEKIILKVNPNVIGNEKQIVSGNGIEIKETDSEVIISNTGTNTLITSNDLKVSVSEDGESNTKSWFLDASDIKNSIGSLEQWQNSHNKTLTIVYGGETISFDGTVDKSLTIDKNESTFTVYTTDGTKTFNCKEDSSVGSLVDPVVLSSYLQNQFTNYNDGHKGVLTLNQTYQTQTQIGTFNNTTDQNFDIADHNTEYLFAESDFATNQLVSQNNYKEFSVALNPTIKQSLSKVDALGRTLTFKRGSTTVDTYNGSSDKEISLGSIVSVNEVISSGSWTSPVAWAFGTWQDVKTTSSLTGGKHIFDIDFEYSYSGTQLGGSPLEMSFDISIFQNGSQVASERKFRIQDLNPFTGYATTGTGHISIVGDLNKGNYTLRVKSNNNYSSGYRVTLNNIYIVDCFVG